MEDLLQKVEAISKAFTKPNEGMPIHLLPPIFYEHITEAHECYGFRPEYLAASLLAATSITIGNTRKVVLKDGFEDCASLYIIIIGDSSAGKSRPMEYFFKHLRRIDREHEHQAKRDIAHWEQSKDDNKGERPVIVNAILESPTPESIILELSKNPRGCGIVKDEAVGIFKDAMGYNGSGGDDRLLSIHSQAPVKTTRATKAQITVEKPFLSVIGGIQPMVAQQLFKGREQSGLTPRFLFVPLAERKANLWKQETPKPKHDVSELLFDLYRNLGFSNDGETVPVYFTDDAAQVIYKEQHRLAGEAIREDDIFAAITGKIESYLLRLSLVLHHLKVASDKSVDEFRITKDTALAAVEFCRYFHRTALDFNSLVYSNAGQLETLPEDRAAFYRALPDTFKRSEAVSIAEDFEISQATVDRFIKNAQLFTRIKTGNFQKTLR